MRVTVHDDTERRRVGSLSRGNETEEYANAGRLRIGWNVEYVPTRGLIGSGELTEVNTVTVRHIRVERVVAEVAIGERSVEREVVPDERVLSLRSGRVAYIVFIAVVVRVFKPD